MSEVKRYKTYSIELQCIDDPCGEFDLSREVVVVLASDFARVEAERDALEAKLRFVGVPTEHQQQTHWRLAERIAELEAQLADVNLMLSTHLAAGTALRERIAALEALIAKAVDVYQRHIVPDGIPAYAAMNEIIGIFDGPEYRAALAGRV